MFGLVGIIVTLTTLVAVGGSMFFVFKMIGGITGNQAEQNRILQTGQPAAGRVVGLGTTGTTVTIMGHRHLQLALTIEVQVPGRPPYVVQTTQLISELRIPSLQPGAQLSLRVDPMNPNKIAIADGAPPPAGGFAPQAAGGWPGAPGGPMAGAPGQPMMGAPGAYGAPPQQGAWGGAPMAPGMGMAGPGMGFVAPDVGQAMKKSLLSPMSLFIFFITTVPITVIMLAVFVDWSAIFGGDEESGVPKGGYCEATARCCKVVFANAANASCDQMKNLPGAGCKQAFEGYQQSAKAQGKTCE